VYRRARTEEVPELFSSLPPTKGPLPDDSCDDVLKVSVEQWLSAANAVGAIPLEERLTGPLSTRMRETLREHGMTVSHDAKLEGTGGSPDILVRGRAGRHHRHPVLMIEVGLHNAEWWRKVDRILKYIVGPKGQDGTFAHPVLTTVLTVELDKERGRSVFMNARIGTFLVTCATSRPSNARDVRAALLRRVETNDLHVLSKEMGRVIRAACFLPDWVDSSRQFPIDENHRQEYLAPHCRRVGSKVMSWPS
jgi:hypothetical protein